MQTALKSWWPLQSVWMDSDHNYGHWTESNEHWYQKRLQQIQVGSAEPIPASKWRDQLRIKQARVLHANVEKLSQDFLRRHGAGG